MIGKFMAKILNFYSFGVAFPHNCPDKRDICQISRLLGQRVVPVGQNKTF